MALSIKTGALYNGSTAVIKVYTGNVQVWPHIGLVGWWRLDEASGSTAVDSSSLGNNGTLQGSPTRITRGNGKALELSGTAQYVTVPDHASLDITGAITLAAWVRLDVLATTYVIKKAAQDVTNGYELGLASTGRPFLRFNQAASLDTYRVNATTILPTNGTWAHVAGTYDGTTMRVYVNATQEGTLTTSPTITTNNIALGLGAEGGGFRPLDGAIDDLRIYNRALSATEITALAT
jgi:large repetitive protein